MKRLFVCAVLMPAFAAALATFTGLEDGPVAMFFGWTAATLYWNWPKPSEA